MLVLAGVSPRFRRMTPDAAQQRGVLAYRQGQHDGNDNCSKHVVLATDKGKSCASLNETRRHEIPAFFESSPRAGQSRPAEFRRPVPKISHRKHALMRSVR